MPIETPILSYSLFTKAIPILIAKEVPIRSKVMIHISALLYLFYDLGKPIQFHLIY